MGMSATDTVNAPVLQIKVGDKWSRLSYGEIVDVNGKDVQIKNEQGTIWWIGKELIEKEFNLADSHYTTRYLNQTAIAELVLSKPGTIMTINFNKKVKEEDVIAEITDVFNRTVLSDNDAKRIAKKILDGEERTLVGRHYHHIDDMGRIQFVDMNLENDDSKDYDTRLRLVDPRTINWVIIENIKYQKR